MIFEVWNAAGKIVGIFYRLGDAIRFARDISGEVCDYQTGKTVKSFL